MTVDDVQRSRSDNSSPRRPHLSLTPSASMPIVTLEGPIGRELASRADSLIQLTTLEHAGAVSIDVSRVEALNGALLGVLLRASRRLAWRNRALIIICSEPENRRGLEMAGLDELATLTDLSAL